MIKLMISDNHGHVANVRDLDGAVVVGLATPVVPPQGQASKLRFYAGVLGSGGGDTGTVNQNVDGSSTNQEFYVGAHEDYDIHIMQVTIVVADTAIVHSKFGNITALTNGWDLIAEEKNEETFLVKQAKTGGQLIAQSAFKAAYGADATSFELTNWTGTEDAQTCVFPIGDFIPGGFRIGRGTTDRLLAVVRDDLQGLTEFTVRAIGYKHYE